MKADYSISRFTKSGYNNKKTHKKPGSDSTKARRESRKDFDQRAFEIRARETLVTKRAIRARDSRRKYPNNVFELERADRN